MMHRPRLKTQLILVVGLLQVYAMGVGVALLFLHRAHSRLEESFSKDLETLSQLPRLRDQMRQLDFFTNQYLTSGGPEVMIKRQETIRELYKTLSGVSSLVAGSKEESMLKNLDTRLVSYVAQQDQWIQRKQAGRLSGASASRLAGHVEVFDEMISQIFALKNANMDILRQQGDALRRTFKSTLIMILITGLAAGIFVAWFLTRYLIGPVGDLRDYARQWSLGAPWEFSAGPAGPEIKDLVGSMNQMASRLNQQYGKEHELNQFKTKLVSLVSHEFNNSLSVIGSAAILLEEGENTTADPERARYFKVLRSHAKTLGILVSNFLEMGRLESGHFAVKPQKTDVMKILKDCLDRLEFLAEQKKIKIELASGAQPLYALVDPQALALVATNLITNAIKYTPKGGKVTIRAGAKGSKIKVEVQDTGIGISREDQEKILSGFYRTEAGKRAAPGFGVGLSIAKSILEAQGSALAVESEPGKGALFFFELPTFS